VQLKVKVKRPNALDLPAPPCSAPAQRSDDGAFARAIRVAFS
jgi:hypothetical protein